MTKRDPQALKNPATALLISGILNLCLAALTILGGLARLLFRIEQLPADDAEMAGFIAGTILGYGVAIVTLAASPVVIFGALQMMRAGSYRMSVTAAVLSVIPLSSCCFLIGIPIGVWALIALRRPGAREMFKETPQHLRPPPRAFED